MRTDEFVDFTENPQLPSDHLRSYPSHAVVDCAADDREIVLLCFQCEAVWHTGVATKRDGSTLLSIKSLLALAEVLYGGVFMEFPIAKTGYKRDPNRHKRRAKGVAA
jgi:hypothetical protein